MARAIWTGTISFGLVSIRVRMFPATESKDIRFSFLDRRDLTPISYEKVRSDDRTKVEPEDVTRGYELETGRWIEITDEEIDRLHPELTHSIDILSFAALGDIDPVYFKKSYFLAPATESRKPYHLLARALSDAARVGVATVVLRNKQHLACVRALDGGGTLVLDTMYRADEVRSPGDLEIDGAGGDLTEAELELARLLIDRLTAPFDPGAVADSYRTELLALVSAKAKGKALPRRPAPAPPPSGDLMEALQASIERSKGPAQARGRRKSAPKGGATPAKAARGKRAKT